MKGMRGRKITMKTKSLMKRLDRFFYSYLLLAVIMLAIGYFWAFTAHNKDTNYEQFKKQFEIELKHELQQEKPITFYISGTNIEVTKQADGSGIVRIVERK